MKTVVSFGFGLLLLSCDAVNQIGYAVVNKRSEPVRIKVPHYAPNGWSAQATDTVISLAPGEHLLIARSMMKIGFPGTAKKIYRESPGICGMELLDADIVVPLGCTRESWKYRRRTSTIFVK